MLNSVRNAALLALCTMGASLVAVPAIAQPGPKINVGGTQISGFPEDWSHRHVIFSNPGTEKDAIATGNYEHWQSVVNNPRYVIQQLKNNRKVEGPSAVDAEYRNLWMANSGDFHPDSWGRDDWRNWRGNKPHTEVKRDWSVALGGHGLADGQYPAKYNYSTATANCNDFVVFPTGAPGSATQATIMAFNNVYSGCPGFSGGNPSTRFSYNTGTGYKATTSPVISWDGSQVAFVQTNGTAAQLVLLKFGNGGGPYNSPTTANSFSASGYRACAAPCYTAISLTNNDTNSAPFYVFEGTLADDIFVGDDIGDVHKLTGAFYGTPALDPSGWPVAIAKQTGQTNIALTSPVYDAGTSGRIFVTDGGGYLHSFTAVGTPGAVGASGRLENNTAGTFEAPLVDSTTEEVYTFVGYSGDTSNPSYINYFPAATALSGGYGSSVKWANGGANNPATSHMRLGAFDNEYYVTGGTTGNLYTCENGVVYQIPVTTGTLATAPTTFSTPVSTVGVASACSPITEFLGTKSTATLNQSGGITSSTSPITIAAGTGTIVSGDYIQIDTEIMKVTAVTGGTSLTVTRGVDGTTAASHSNGAAISDVQDWLFLSVQANGNATVSPTCSGACVYNYNVISEPTTGNPVDGLAAAGGTSGISIDSSSTSITGDEEIYYTQLGGTSAIQASQAALQ